MIEDITKRAETVAEMAPSDSVTVGVLAGYKSRSRVTPLNNPPLTYLDGAEAPAYLLTNGSAASVAERNARPNHRSATDGPSFWLPAAGRSSHRERRGRRHHRDPTRSSCRRSGDGFGAQRSRWTPDSRTTKTTGVLLHGRRNNAKAAAEFIENHQQDSPDAIDGDDDANQS